MLKLLGPDIWVYDVEWVPDPMTCRLVFGLPADMPDADVVEHAYGDARAKQEKQGRTADERPMLKTALCRIVAISAVKRIERKGQVRLQLKSLPAIEGTPLDEREIIDKFLSSVGATKPQLVGFASREADMPILLQRAVVHGLSQPQFGARPKKPWEGVDYFHKQTDYHVDLLDILANYSRGNQMPSLHQICVASGIPGKFMAGGDDVAELLKTGQLTKIVQYNQCDVLSQYELLMRVALLAGLITPAAYAQEQRVFEQMLVDLIQAAAASIEHNLVASHLGRYVLERERLRQALGIKAPDPAPAGTATQLALGVPDAPKAAPGDALDRAMEAAGV